jgi:hypothetical protein
MLLNIKLAIEAFVLLAELKMSFFIATWTYMRHVVLNLQYC